MRWEDAVSVLRAWEGRPVVVVPYLEPGISLEPVRGPLEVEPDERSVVRLRFRDMAIALPRATFIEAAWVPGREDQGLTVVQGGTRVDVFLEDAAA
jgi:hypothetical protein